MAHESMTTHSDSEMKRNKETKSKKERTSQSTAKASAFDVACFIFLATIILRA